MIVCQNDDNKYQFTVILENLESDDGGENEIKLFEGAANNNFEQSLYKIIMDGLTCNQ